MLSVEIKVYTLTKIYTINGSHLTEDGVRFDNYCMSGEFIQYGTTISPQLEFFYWEDLMPNIDWKVVDFIEYYVNGNRLFRGLVEEAKRSDDMVRVVALGLMSKLDEEPYVPEIHTNIFTSRNAVDIVKNCLSYIISKNPTLGHTIVSKYSIATMPVVTKITEETVKGATLGDFVRWALEIMGAVLIEEKGTFNITTPSNTVVKTFDQSVIYDPLVINEEELTISGVIIVAQEVKSNEEGEPEYVGTELLAGTNYSPIVINNNPFALENATQLWADTLYERDKFIAWRPIIANLDFDDAYDTPLFSMVQIQDRAGTTYKTLVTSVDSSHGGRTSIESVGMNWKPEVKTIGSPSYRSAELERRLIDNNLALIRDRFRNNLQEVLGNLEQETQDRINSVNNAIEIAKNSPVTSTRITENAIQTSHIAADAVTATALKVDQALIDKLTLTSLLADTIWTKTLSAKQISSEQIYVTQAFIDALFVDMMKAGSITTEMLSSDVGQSLDLSSNESVNIMVEEKGKYKNLISGADGFAATSHEKAIVSGDSKRGELVFRDSDGSVELRCNDGAGIYFFRIPIEQTDKVDFYTLWLGRFYRSDNVTNVQAMLIDEDGYWYSGRTVDLIANKINYIAKWDSTPSTRPLRYLQFEITVSSTSTAQGVRLYAKNIVLVTDKVPQITWEKSYLSSSTTLFKMTKDSILSQVDNAYIKISSAGELINNAVSSSNSYTDSKLSQITLSADKIKLEGYTSINSGFKVLSNGSFEAISGSIAGWDISSNRLSKTTTSGSHMTVLNSDRSFPYVMGTWEKDSSGSYNNLKWKIDWDGTLYARGADITGTINVTDGSIGGLSITSGGLAISGTDYYAHVSGTSSYPFFAGPNSNSSRFRVSRDGDVLARSITLTGGKVGGTTINSSSLSGGSFSSGSFTTGSYSGSSYGYGDFSSGSYIGSGYFGSGSLAGVSYSSRAGGIKMSGNLEVANGLYVSSIFLGRGTIYGTSSSGQGVTATMETGGWSFTNSDIRLKENIEELTDEYNKYIYDLPLIKYNYKSDEKHRPQVGVNANLLMKILPEKMAKSFLHQDEETGLYGANYELLVPYTIKAIQDLNKRLERLENE